MRVLHVIPSLSPLRGGPSVALPVMARALSGLGIQVDVVTTDDDGPGRLYVPGRRWLDADGYRVRYFPRQVRPYTISVPLGGWLRRNVGTYDVVHTHALFSHAPAAAARAAHIRGIPYVCRPLGTLNRWGMERRRPWLKRIWLRGVETAVLEHAAAVQFTSEQELAEARRLGVPFHPVVIPIGVEVAPPTDPNRENGFLARYPEMARQTVILSLSRLDAKKGLDLLLQAYASIQGRYRDAVLVVAGDGDECLARQLRDIASALGLADRVIWTGFLDRQAKWDALVMSSVFVLPSRSENFGIAAVEAMSAGVPVILSDGVGIATDVAKARAGIVVPPDAEGIAGALARLLNDPRMATVMGANGRRLASERYSPRACAVALLDLYEQVASSRQSARVTAGADPGDRAIREGQAP